MEEIILQVPSLDPPFSIFIDLCSCDFQAVESFAVQMCLDSLKKILPSMLLTLTQVGEFHLATASSNDTAITEQYIIPREARAEGPSVARLINLSSRAGPSGAKPREFERKIYLYIYI